jgi:hypothetical protein
MPQRTNLFQRLAATVHSHLSKGWNVAESVMLIDSLTGELREVDVVAKATVATYDIYLSIECRDHARPADVTWIESMAKKHESLPTSKLVLWSRSGFTKTAILKAKALKINTISQAETINTDWAKLARDIVGGYINYLTPTFLTPVIDVMLPDKTLFRIEDASLTSWDNAAGENVGSMQALVAHIKYRPDLATVFLDHAPIGSGSFHIEVEPDQPWFTMTFDGQKASIRRILIGISTVMEQAPLDSASANIDGCVMTLASANIASGRFDSFIIESPDGSSVVQTQHILKT